MANPLKPWSNPPWDAHPEWLQWVTSALNQLIGQAGVTSGAGFPALSVPTVDPSTSQVKSIGSRPQSLTTPIKYSAGTSSVSFFWDGTNSSVGFQIYRDDGTVTPAVLGNLVVSGLSANTQYFFYPYFDETVNLIKFVNLQGVSVGTPAVAFTSQNILAAQQQLLRTHIPLSVLFATTGVTTPNAGTTSGSGGTGGGGGSGGAGKYAQ